MANKQKSNVDIWLERETNHNREALENASRYFAGNDNLTVNTLEAIYGQESSFGLNSMMGERGSSLSGKLKTIGVKNASEREKFVLGAFNAGEGNIARAQALVKKAGKNSQLWSDVEKYLTDETRQYIPNVLFYQEEFNLKSPANKKIKQKEPKKQYRCTEGHWATIDDRPVFICD